MQLSVQLTSATGEAFASGGQVTNAISAFVDDLSKTRPQFEKIDRLALCLVLSHPLAAPNAGQVRARYHAATKTVFAEASINYEQWLEENWVNRLEAAGDALVASVGAVAKSRLTAEERTQVINVLREGMELAKASRPKTLIPLGSVYLNSHPGSDKPSIGFGEGPSAGDAVELKPSELRNYLDHNPQEPAVPPSMFKLYARRDRHLDYHEAWIRDGEIIEHWGKCGERGEMRRHTVGPDKDSFALLNSLACTAKAAGFKAIPLSRHKGLIVEKQIEGFGSPEELERRHELEALLDDKLGWLGLGHCDGGSIGSGSMEAYCLVVDGPIAVEALRRELAVSPFNDFRVRSDPDHS